MTEKSYRIKPLVFRQERPDYQRYYAMTGNDDTYVIFQALSSMAWRWYFDPENYTSYELIDDCVSYEECVAECQNHYQQSLLSCLEEVTDDIVPGE